MGADYKYLFDAIFLELFNIRKSQFLEFSFFPQSPCWVATTGLFFSQNCYFIYYTCLLRKFCKVSYVFSDSGIKAAHAPNPKKIFKLMTFICILHTQIFQPGISTWLLELNVFPYSPKLSSRDDFFLSNLPCSTSFLLMSIMIGRCFTSTGQLYTHAAQVVHDQSSSSPTMLCNCMFSPFLPAIASFLIKTLGERGLETLVAGHAASHAPISTQASRLFSSNF